MPNFCAVVGCGSRGNRDRNSFFRIPCIPIKGQTEMIALKTERRMKWILALRRKDLTESKLKYALICDRHFISGRPAATRDTYNLDWVPSQNMGYDINSPSPKCRVQNESKGAIICYVAPSIPDQAQEKRTEKKITNQDEDSESRINFIPSSGMNEISFEPLDQNEKRDAVVCYIKPNIPEQIHRVRTKHTMINVDKINSSDINFAYSKVEEHDPSRKGNLNGDAIICYITPKISQQFQVKRTLSEMIHQDEDS